MKLLQITLMCRITGDKNALIMDSTVALYYNNQINF